MVAGSRQLNAIEKVRQLRTFLLKQKPEDEETAQALQLFVAFSPAVMGMLPDDPAVLDTQLAQIATWALECRGDEAPTLAIHQWNEAEDKWEAAA